MDRVELYSNIRQTMELIFKMRKACRCRFDQICKLDSSDDESLREAKKIFDLNMSRQEEILLAINRLMELEFLECEQLKLIKEQVDKLFVATIHMGLGVEGCYRGIAGLNGQA